MMLEEIIAAYSSKRMRSLPLPSGSAPYTNSGSFKLKAQKEKPKAKDWTRHFSVEVKNQSTSTLKEASRKATTSDLLSLGTARPNPNLYPWQTMTMLIEEAISPTKTIEHASTSMSCSRGETGFDLGLALNYGYAAGSPQLLRFVTEHIEMTHNPPYQDWECSLTCSTTSAIDILLRLLCNRGEWIMTEEYTYPGTVEAAKRIGLNVLPITMDEMGLVPQDLDQKLRQWTLESSKPSVLYTIPTGQNPTGVTQPTIRKREIYKVAEEHDLLIIEDDPYFFIQLKAQTAVVGDCAMASQEDQYLRRLPSSYLSLDTSGRVVRLETTSKILAPGLRCGWLTGPRQLVSSFISATELSAVAPNGLSQAVLYKLLDETWGHRNFLVWLDNLSLQYQRRLDIMLSACGRHLPAEICTWSVPGSGMFLWIKVKWTQHPLAISKGVDDQSSGIVLEIEEKIYQACHCQGVQISKGSWFAPGRPLANEVFFRVTFAAIMESDLVEAVKRIGRAFHKDFELSNGS